MIFNLKLLEATSTTHLALRMCHGCVYKCRIVLGCHALYYLQHFIGQCELLLYKLNCSLFISEVLQYGKCVFIFHTDVFIDVSLMS